MNELLKCGENLTLVMKAEEAPENKPPAAEIIKLSERKFKNGALLWIQIRIYFQNFSHLKK